MEDECLRDRTEATEADHHRQSMIVDTEEAEDDTEIETPVPRQDPSGESVLHDIAELLPPEVRDNITAEDGETETDITIVEAAETVPVTDIPVAVREVIVGVTDTEMTEMTGFMLEAEVLKLQHQEIHHEATHEHSY